MNAWLMNAWLRKNNLHPDESLVGGETSLLHSPGGISGRQIQGK
jgi:hypothetical protein